MKLIFNLDGIRVWAGSIVLGDQEVQEVGIAGMVSGPKGTWEELYTWKAFARPFGWQVWLIQESTGKTRHLDGSTFNLGLEVVVAFKYC